MANTLQIKQQSLIDPLFVLFCGALIVDVIIVAVVILAVVIVVVIVMLFSTNGFGPYL